MNIPLLNCCCPQVAVTAVAVKIVERDGLEKSSWSRGKIDFVRERSKLESSDEREEVS